MGSSFSSLDTIYEYHAREAGLFFSITSLVLIIPIIVIIILCIKRCTCCNQKGCRECCRECCKEYFKEIYCSSEPNARVTKFFKACSTFIKVCDETCYKYRTKFHRVLHVPFSGLITTNTKVQCVEDSNIISSAEETYLFGGKELKGCYCYTYVYFTAIALLAIIWFILICVESGIYRKTTTCNDINVQDKSYSCFAIANKTNDTYRRIGMMPINCTIGKSPNISVFCYLYNLRPAAIGSAVGIAKLITFVTSVYFRIVIFCVSKNKCITSFLQISLGILFIMSFVIILPDRHFRHDAELYFFHGNDPLRWTSYFLVIITGLVLIPIPWCGFTKKDKFQDMVILEDIIVPSVRFNVNTETVSLSGMLLVDQTGTDDV